MDQELMQLGKLSEKYETPYPGPKGAGVISSGKGDAGGVSYGSYQLASKTGTAAAFVKWLQTHDPGMHGMLQPFDPGTVEFNLIWMEIAAKNTVRFFEAQHLFIAATHYIPARRGVETELKLSLAGRSLALKDALWSCAVQHGPRAAYNKIWRAALGQLGPSTHDDASILKAVYAERGRTDADGHLVYFPRCSAEVQKGVAKRFANELRDVLQRLAC